MNLPRAALSHAKSDIASIHKQREKPQSPRRSQVRLATPEALRPGATHHTGPGVGDTALVGHPLVHGSLLVCKGSEEGPTNIVHIVHTYCRALEDTTADRQRSMVEQGPQEFRPHPTPPHPPTPINSSTSPGCGKDSIEYRCPAIPRGQQENILCREGTEVRQLHGPAPAIWAPAPRALQRHLPFLALTELVKVRVTLDARH